MAKQLQSGDTDRKMDVLKPETLVTELGEEANTTLGPFKMGVPCMWEELDGSEKPESNRETAFGQARATTRYEAANGILETMTIRYEGRNYDILNIREKPGSRRQWREIMVKRHD
jgi:head-tail adaptor